MVEQSIFVDIARLRWPNYSVSGVGTLAVVLACSNRVVLCDMPMVAQTIRQEPCCQFCNHPEHTWHRIEKLIQPRERVRARQRRWQDDKD
jgi:hypothetical protein